MLRNRLAALVGSVVLVASGHAHAAQAKAAPPSVASSAGARALLDKYCVTCHNARLKTGGLTLDDLDITNLEGHADRAEKVIRKLRVGAMPPLGLPRPDDTTYTGLATWLEAQLDRAAVTRPRPGRTETLHRLNRAEYQNAIRDLLDIEGLDVSMMLPVDDASYGFDNVAGILGISPTHLERYLAAARNISRIAVGDLTLGASGETYTVRPDLSQEDRLEELPFGTRGGSLLRRYFPVDGEYIVRFSTVPAVGAAEQESQQIEASIDGVPVFTTPVVQKLVKGDERANTDYEFRLPIKAGLRELAVTFIETTSAQHEDLLQPYLRPPSVSTFKLSQVGGYRGAYVTWVSFVGPLNVTGVGNTPSRRRVFECRPASAAEETPCARRILSTLTRRAFRRPVTETDLAPMLEFYKAERAKGDFDGGIQFALERLLGSPEFLFRIERDPARTPAGAAYRISDLELASRLSFFLWSSIPDDELVDVASRGQLHNPPVLERQVRRMLADPRSAALVENFAGQWLRLRNLRGANPDTRMFPDFDQTLRDAFRRETELFFESIVREDRSALDLLDADYTYLNERLARHYGVPDVYGPRFRRVTLADQNRRGLLGQGSILTVTSQANRTSPVVRGKWILENLLGAPPPPPPPNVPALEETKLEGTLRQRMEQHRKNPTCASCHKVMDPLGFPLENFDAVGTWRTRDAGIAVDAEGALPDGTRFQGVSGLRTALRAKGDVFVATLAEKLLTYALGRGLESYDAPAIRTIVRDAARSEYRFSSVILGIVKSVPFSLRQSEATPGETPASTSASR